MSVFVVADIAWKISHSSASFDSGGFAETPGRTRSFFIVNGLKKLTEKQRHRLMVASRKIEISGALNEQHGVMILGGTAADIEKFCDRVSAITQCSVAEESDYWDGPMEIGFVLRR